MQKFLTDHWENPDKLLAFIHAYGHADVKRPMVNQWFRRGSLPPNWFGKLCGYLEAENGGISFREYL